MGTRILPYSTMGFGYVRASSLGRSHNATAMPGVFPLFATKYTSAQFIRQNPSKIMKEKSSISYESVPGFFVQDVAGAELPLSFIPPRFGLVDASDDRWAKFEEKVQQLNKDSPIGTSYKFFLFTRHGQGYHNVGISKYGTTEWEQYLSKLHGDGEIVWGPDPQLTPLGIEQAHLIQDMWKTESLYGLAPPHRLYCSPLSRALHTCDIMLDGVFQLNHTPVTVVESCRETHGVSTCDKRKPRTYIASSFPHFTIEEGFTELDEIWSPTIRESTTQVAERAQKVLDIIFQKDVDAQFISITAHEGFIHGMLAAIGRQEIPVPTGGFIPVVIKSQTSI